LLSGTSSDIVKSKKRINLNWIDAFPEPEKCFGNLCESVRKLLPIEPDKETDTATPAPAPAPPKPEPFVPTNQYILKIHPNLTCAVFVDYEPRIEAPAGKITKLSMNRGTFLLKFVSTENEQDKFVIEEYAITEPEQLLHVDLESIAQKRKEKEWIAYLEKLELVAYRDVSGKYGFKDKATGNIIIQAKYDYTYSFSEGLATVRLNGKDGFIDKTEKIVIPLKYDNAHSFSEGLAAVKLNDKWGYIDKTGKIVIPLNYEDAYSFSEGLAAVKLNDKWGFIDKTGKIVIPLKYEDAYSFSEGLAKVQLTGKWGFIDKTEKIVIPLKYDYASWFGEGLAPVKLNDKWGFIDKTGKEVIPLKYNIVWSFSGGTAKVKLDSETFHIDKSGNRVW
jgi:hypothetical protein